MNMKQAMNQVVTNSMAPIAGQDNEEPRGGSGDAKRSPIPSTGNNQTERDTKILLDIDKGLARM